MQTRTLTGANTHTLLGGDALQPSIAVLIFGLSTQGKRGAKWRGFSAARDHFSCCQSSRCASHMPSALSSHRLSLQQAAQSKACYHFREMTVNQRQTSGQGHARSTWSSTSLSVHDQDVPFLTGTRPVTCLKRVCGATRTGLLDHGPPVDAAPLNECSLCTNAFRCKCAFHFDLWWALLLHAC